MRSVQTVAPTADPITLADCRTWLTFATGITEEDPILSEVIDEAASYLEAETGHKLITQTWTVSLDADEISSEITIPIVPVQSVSSVVTYDSSGNSSTIDSSNYQLITGLQPKLVLASSGSWGTYRDYDSMVITLVVGYGDADSDIPGRVRMLLKGLIQHHYRSKGLGVAETASGQLIGMPQQLVRMIESIRVRPV